VKLVILAGGLGSRISEESGTRPKPMIEIGGRPILWHIMKIYAQHGIRDFVVCCGYKGYVIKEYFANYFLHMSDVTFDMEHNTMEVHRRLAEPWRVTLVDTGEATMTGGRIRRVREHVERDDEFCLTYGDGVGNVDISSVIAFHRDQGGECTLTAVQPPGRFGALRIDSGNRITTFQEKPHGDGAWINGGFFVCHPSVIDRIDGDQTIWEREPLESLAADGQLAAYKHFGFWQPMDTLRDKQHLENLWESGDAPWRVW
jgi:glucose-1-phosphate cytidylyltransferase